MSRELFASGVIPARKAVVHAAARLAIQALVEDLGSPGVFREANYDLIRVIASMESAHPHPSFTTRDLEGIARHYRLQGKAEDSVCDLIQVYVDARRKLGE